MQEFTDVQLYKDLIIIWKFHRLQPIKSLPQTTGIGQSENTQKITKPNTQTSCYRSWAVFISCEHNLLLMRNPVKTCKPGRLTHYHRYAIPQPQDRRGLYLQLTFQRTVNVKGYDSHKEPAHSFGMSEIPSLCTVSLPVGAQRQR